MSVPTASAVGFAVSDGHPADARTWITVDFDGHLSPLKRGYFVVTEPTEDSPRGEALAAQARELIIGELRRHQHMPPDIALGRAFARANGHVIGELQTGPEAGYEQRIFVGATACIIDDHTLTIAHVPPGQMIMIEDGLVYAVPALDTWLPDYHGAAGNGAAAPEPLGYAAQVRPHLATSELRPGDVLVLANSECGALLAERMAAGRPAGPVAHLFGRDPDMVLDYFRSLIIDNDVTDAAVAVLALPPLPGSLQIQTVADVGRRVREEWRHTRAAVGQAMPGLGRRPAVNPFSSQAAGVEYQRRGALKPMVEIPEYSITSPREEPAHNLPPTLTDGLKVTADATRAERRAGLQQRLQSLAERGTPKWVSTWRQPTETHQFGVPGAHGVQIFRGNRSPMGDPSWKNYLPRLPLISAGLLWILLVAVLLLGLVGGAFVLDRLGNDERDYSATFTQIDRQITAALAIADPTARETALNQAETMIMSARDAGAPEDELRPRALAISRERDALENIVRTTGVKRIGSLPAPLKSHQARIVQTPAGIFVVAGSLYRLHPDTGELEQVLVEGSVVDSAAVRTLYGIGFDSEGLYVTDGLHIFVLGASGQWLATEMREINQLGPWQAGPTDAFGGNVYVLEPEYRNIYWFETNPENGIADPNEWVNRGDRNSLDSAVDMTIDGNIYVLQKDGRVQTFYLGDLDAEFVPTWLGTGTPVAIVNGTNTGYLYVAVNDGTGGRVLAFPPDGRHVYQLELPTMFDAGTDEVMAPFEQVQDIAVDEATGTIYVVNGDGVWSMNYSLPAMPEAASTPEAPTPNP